MEKHDFAIRVQNIGKQYRRGVHKGRFAMQNQLEEALRNPFKKVAGLFKSSTTDQDLETTPNGYFWALRNVSFEIKHGELVGIIGHNGAGKSVLLKILSQITKPTEGYAEIQGSCSSMLEVDSGFHVELTGHENIFMSGAILGMKKPYIDQKYNEIVELSELQGFLDTPVKRYSSGMRVRLAFAVAAQLQPDILIMDEILAVGDKSFRMKCVNHLHKLRNKDQTIIIVSHNMSTIQELCDRVIWIDHGRLRLDGHPQEIVAEYMAERKSNFSANVLK